MQRAIAAGPKARIGDRLAAGFLVVLMAIGSLTLWIGVPAASLWAASKLTDSQVTHYLIALPLTLVAVGAFGAFLFWLNRLYLRVSGVMAFYAQDEDYDEDEDDPARVPRGPLEPLLVGSLVIAVVAMLGWFFVLAENPSVSIY